MSKKHKRHMEEKVETLALEQIADRTETDKLYNKFDPYQREMDRKIEEYSVVFVDAEAGTGKTTVAVRKALEMLRQGKVNKIHYVRFPDKRGQKLGFLPGEKEDKEAVYMYPFYDAMAECGIQEAAVDKLIEKGIIELSTDINLRGRNLKGVFLIVDEAQNAEELGDLKLVLTRLHDHRGKGVVIGHSKQVDGRVRLYTKHRLTSFQIYRYHMTKKPWATTAHLMMNYRGEISKWADRVEESLPEIELMDDFV